MRGDAGPSPSLRRGTGLDIWNNQPLFQKPCPAVSSLSWQTLPLLLQSMALASNSSLTSHYFPTYKSGTQGESWVLQSKLQNSLHVLAPLQPSVHPWIHGPRPDISHQSVCDQKSRKVGNLPQESWNACVCVWTEFPEASVMEAKQLAPTEPCPLSVFFR